MTDAVPGEEAGWATARTLAEALPFISAYDRETVVIKYGGHAMGEETVAKSFAADAVLLKLLGVHPVVVHGGGPQISRMLQKAGVSSTFIDGLRVTDEATMEVAEMVLSGAINKEIVHFINRAGADADVRGVGLSGKDARLITVVKAHRTRVDPDSRIEQAIDLGFVGEPKPCGPASSLRGADGQCGAGLRAGDRADRRVGRGRHLQRQRRHRRGRHRRRAEAPSAC